MTVILSDESYHGLLNDNEKLHEEIAELMVRNVNLTKRNRELKHKVQAFDEIEGLVSKTKSAEDLGECVLQLLIENKEANHEG